MIYRIFALCVAGAVAVAALLTPAAPTYAATSLTGAGSTFVYPFFSKAFSVYQKKSGVSVNYQSIGSGGGIQQFTAKTVDFGASDVPANTSELAAARKAGGAVVQFPVALGGESIVYHVPGVKSGRLRLSSDVISDLFLGVITKWNDSRIKKLNPKLKLPSLPVVVAHRSDSSGTTYIFTDYLSNVSDQWRGQVGTGKAVNWPVGVGGKGNEGVAATVEQQPGGVGYVELAYALQTHLAQAQIRNRSGHYVADSIKSVRAAAATRPSVSPTHFSIVNAKGAKSYPICGYTWVMIFKHQSSASKAKALAKLFQWTTSTAQRYAQGLDYVPLPRNVQKVGTTELKQIK